MADLSEDSRIVGDVLNGDVNAFGLLVQKYQKPIYNLMYRVTGSEDTSLDLAQETFVRAYEKLERFDPGRSFFSWLYAIGVNLSKDYLRRAGRESRHMGRSFDENRAFDAKLDQEARLDRKQETARLIKALDQLPFDHREAVLLRFKEELSMKDISRALSVSVSGAKMRVHRALKKLHNMLQENSCEANPEA